MTNRTFVLFSGLYILVAYYLYGQGYLVSTAGLALTLALFGFIWQIYAYFRQGQYDKSAFRLASALDAFEEAHKLLRDKNNDRVIWITAARALGRGTRIASGITEEVHKDVLEVQRDRYRLIFGVILGFDNQGVTGSFFYGAPDDIVDIDDAAKHASKDEKGRPQLRNLSEKTLKVIWDFAQFPDRYEDPISDVSEFSEKDVNNDFKILSYPGLFEFLRHYRKFISVKGQLHPRSQPEEDTLE